MSCSKKWVARWMTYVGLIAKLWHETLQNVMFITKWKIVIDRGLLSNAIFEFIFLSFISMRGRIIFFTFVAPSGSWMKPLNKTKMRGSSILRIKMVIINERCSLPLYSRESRWIYSGGQLRFYHWSWIENISKNHM